MINQSTIKGIFCQFTKALLITTLLLLVSFSLVYAQDQNIELGPSAGDISDVWETQQMAQNVERNLDKPPTNNELGFICYASDGSEKRITPKGAIWLAKMIDGETWGNPSEEDAKAMLWALTQRTGIWNFRKWSLKRMVQAYSQPVNPKWTRSGKKCAKYYQPDWTDDIPKKCSKKRVNRREWNIKKLNWTNIHPITRRVVLAFAAGRIPNHISGVVGWFAPKTWESRETKGHNKTSNMIFHSEIDGNVYFSMNKNPNTTRWEDHEVTVVGPDTMCPMIINTK